MIVVTTGGGFEYSEIEPYMLAAMGDLNPLPANPEGVASLDAALTTIATGPEPEPVPSLPATAQAISGQKFVFESNRIGLLSVRLDFDNYAEAVLQLEIASEAGPRVIGVGLDGVYRNSRSGRPILARGNWKDEKTFVLDYNEGPGFAAYTIRFSFEGDGVVFEAPGLGRFEANAIQP
jgi:hypothetical protein